MGTTTVWAPPGPLATAQSWGGRQSREEDGSGLRSFLGVPKSPVRVLTLAFSEAPTSVPDHRGLRVGRGRLFRSPSQRFRSGRWLWVAALLGSLSRSGRAGACPQLSPRSGCRRSARSGLPRQRVDLSSSLGTRPSAALRRGNPGSVRTGTRRPAAQDDIKSPPPARPAPLRGLGGWREGSAASGNSRGRWEM